MAQVSAGEPLGWGEASLAAAACAVDPSGLGGVLLRGAAGPVRDAWLQQLRTLLPAEAPLRRVPLHVQDERLLGGLDLAATLRCGHAVAQRGLLAEADGGIVVLAMAERISAGTAARLAAVLDAGEVLVARDGVTLSHASRIGIVALDEGEDDERAPSALTDRLAIWLDLAQLAPSALAQPDMAVPDADEVRTARERLSSVRVDDDVWGALCAAAQSLGILSMRAPLLAVRVARTIAALAGRDRVEPDDAAIGARWVLGPRARVQPPASQTPQDSAPAPDEPPSPPSNDTSVDARSTEPPPDSTHDEAQAAPDRAADAIDEVVIAAAVATLPARLFDRFALRESAGKGQNEAGGAGAARAAGRRGAPIGSVRGTIRSGQRLDLLATLRAAAPWQRLRSTAEAARGAGHVAVRAEDYRIRRFRQRRQTTVIFVVDASGSSALHRLDEAKGAVVLLLADCYARRDSVAVLAFRGVTAELLLPPTRSLVRARRSLAGLPGGGATPLASAIDAAALLADAVRRHGDTPLAVLLTDGCANVARDGTHGRDRAQSDALLAARGLRTGGLACIVLDTSPRPQPAAQRLAEQMGARYLPLPHADANSVCDVVRGAKRACAQERA